MASEYERVKSSLIEYNLPKKDELIDMVYNKIKNKSLDDIVWKEEGGNAKPIGLYFNGSWHYIEEAQDNVINGIEIIRKSKNAPSFSSDEEKKSEYWRIRKIKFIRKGESMVPIGDWMEYPSEVTSKVREIVGNIYNDMVKEYPFFEITLFGSAANGTMKNGSDLEYSLIFDIKKMKESEQYIKNFDKIKGDNPFNLTGNHLENYAETTTVNKIENEIKNKFETAIKYLAQKFGINLDIGYNYIATGSSSEVIYDPYGTSKKPHKRILYSYGSVKVIEYNKIIKVD